MSGLSYPALIIISLFYKGFTMNHTVTCNNIPLIYIVAFHLLTYTMYTIYKPPHFQTHTHPHIPCTQYTNSHFHTHTHPHTHPPTHPHTQSHTRQMLRIFDIYNTIRFTLLTCWTFVCFQMSICGMHLVLFPIIYLWNSLPVYGNI